MNTSDKIENPLFAIPPSVFHELPADSTLQRKAPEAVARNIMAVRDRLGKWDISEEEYVAERKKKRNFKESELPYFREVLPLLKDSVMCRAFSGVWGGAGRTYLKEKSIAANASPAPSKKKAK